MTTLSEAQIEAFITDGFVHVPEAFPRPVADAGRAILWRETGCDPDDPATWTRPVIRLGDHAEPPFDQAANTPRLTAALDELVGPGRWQARRSLGTFPIRFPSPEDPGDAGWHIDVSFPGPGADITDYFQWRANIASRGRALLMLFLFSDVGEDDAPTRIRIGSHQTIARLLEPEGEAGLLFMPVAQLADAATQDLAETTAIGQAGDVYLCHPFLLHSAQSMRAGRPKFMAQPPLLPAEPLALERPGGDYSPVETAIRRAIGRP